MAIEAAKKSDRRGIIIDPSQRPTAPQNNQDNEIFHFNPSNGDVYMEPDLNPKPLDTIAAGQVGNVKDFKAKGRQIFTDDDYAGSNKKARHDFRLQYALRHYAEKYKGLDIGTYGDGGWGGDCKIGKKCIDAIDYIMMKERIKTREQAIAWVIDKTRNDLGLWMGKPFYNPKTMAFNSDQPLWFSKPKEANPLMWEDPLFCQYEDERRYGSKRARLEEVWAEQIEPALRNNGRSEKYIEKTKEKFFADGKNLMHSENIKSDKDYKKQVNKNCDVILVQEERYALVKNVWDHQINPALRKNHRSKEYIQKTKREFFAMANKLVYANDKTSAIEAAGKVGGKREEILETEKRYEWARNQWKMEIAPGLGKKGITADSDDPKVRKIYFGYLSVFKDLTTEYVNADDGSEVTIARNNFLTAKERTI